MGMHSEDLESELASAVGDVAGTALKYELSRSFEEISIVILRTLLSKGYRLSGFAGALADICLERGHNRASGYFENAERSLEDDEGDSADRSDQSYVSEAVGECFYKIERVLPKAQKYRNQLPQLATALADMLTACQEAKAVLDRFPIYTDEELKRGGEGGR